MHSRLDRVTDWEERAKEACWCVIALACQLQVTRRHLRRYFLARFDMSPHSWLERTRMKVAAQLIAEGRPIKAIAVELGFKQTSHFCQAFRRVHGHHATVALAFPIPHRAANVRFT